MNNKQLRLYVKDIAKTRFMQTLDAFESFKFVGHTLIAETDGRYVETPVEEILTIIASKNMGNDFAVVGVEKPDGKRAMLPNHRVMSDGKKFAVLEQS